MTLRTLQFLDILIVVDSSWYEATIFEGIHVEYV